MKTIAPSDAKRLIDAGAVLLDVREADEHARERIPGARLAPVGRLDAADVQGARTVIFHCRSGNRTAANSERLRAAAADCDAYILAGGIEAWKRAGLPVQTDRSRPIEIMRQVQIAAGLLVLAGVILGTLTHPAFYAVSAFVGAGLTFAGVTGWCGMARLLALMPWNRVDVASAGQAG